MTLNRNINLKENNNKAFKRRKKLSGLIEYNSQTLDRNNIKNNFIMNKIQNLTKKRLNSNNELISPHINKEILFPQTPQIKKNILYNKINIGNSELIKNKTKEFVNKSKDEENNNLNFIKEYKEILEKLKNTINSNIYYNK